MIKKAMITGVFYWAFLSTATLGVVSIELDFPRDEDRSTYFESGIDFTQKTGNVNSTALGIDFRLDSFSGKNHYVIMADKRSRSVSQVEYDDYLMVHLRFIRQLTEHMFSELFIQNEQNPYVSLNQRQLYGLSFRHELLRRRNEFYDTTIFGATGMMLELEALSSEPDDRRYRFNNYLNARIVSDQRYEMQLITYFQPMVGLFSDYRLLAEAKLSYHLNAYLRWNLSIEYRYDHMPPVGVRQGDRLIKQSISWEY